MKKPIIINENRVKIMGGILVIAPYQGLKELFVEVNKELMKDLDIRYGDLYEGLQIAKRLEDKGYDVIISRGATAQLLREHCSLPIVDVNFSAYDILRALRLMKEFPGEKGIMSYFNVVRGADEIGQLLDINLRFYPVYGTSDMEIQMSKAIKDGIETVIGDAVTTSYAKQHGLRTVLITSGRESVIDAIQSAEQIAYYTQREKEKIRRLDHSLNGVDEGLVIFDHHGQVQRTNTTIIEQLAVVGDELTLTQISDNFPFLNVESSLHQGDNQELFIKLNDQRYHIVKKPIFDNKKIIGAMAIVRQETLEKMSMMDNSALKPFTSFSQFVSHTAPFHTIIESAKKMSQSTLSIMINGEDGTGKRSLAEAIHNNSQRKAGPFLSFNCSAYSENDCEQLLFGSDGINIRPGMIEQASGGTLYLKDIEKLPMHIQEELVTVINQQKLTQLNDHFPMTVSIRLIASSRKRLKQLKDEQQLSIKLYDVLNTFTLPLPPLRERQGDLHHLAMHFIAMYNQRAEKQIVGLSQGLLKRLVKYSWPGNISELKYVIYKMCKKSNGPFIDVHEVEDIIEKLQGASIEPKQLSVTILGKTLKDIEKEVITQLLEKEAFNQSKVARSLGINRTTLWRKLNQDN